MATKISERAQQAAGLPVPTNGKVNNMQVSIKIVPDDRPNDDGEWATVNPSVIERASIADRSSERASISKWSVAEKILRQYAPAGFHIVSYELKDNV